MIFIVWVPDDDSTSGAAITGVFDFRESAENFAKSEGPDYKVFETSFGPIDWNKMNPIPPYVDPADGIDWSDWNGK